MRRIPAKSVDWRSYYNRQLTLSESAEGPTDLIQRAQGFVEGMSEDLYLRDIFGASKKQLVQ